MDFLKFYKKEVLVSIFSASMLLIYLNYLYSEKRKKKFSFKREHKEKSEKTKIFDKFIGFFKPFSIKNRNNRAERGINQETSDEKLVKIMKMQQLNKNNGKQIGDFAEIFEKTGEDLEKIDFKALSFHQRFKGKKFRGNKKQKKAKYSQLREERNKLKNIVNDLYLFNKTENGIL